MFSPSLLYDRQTNQKTVVSFHATAMCHVAKNIGAGIPSGMPATLQMQTLLGHNIADTYMPSYLLAKDAYGYQVYIASPAEWKDQWTDIMNGGFGDWPALPSKGYLALNRIAALIYADLITRVTLADNLFIAAHGPYAGVANILCKMLIAHGNKVAQIYKIAAAKSFTEQAWNAIDALDVENVQVQSWTDETVDCPPSLLSFDGFGRGLVNFAVGQETIIPRLYRYGTPHMIGTNNNRSGQQTQGWPNQAAALHIGTPNHWHDDVDVVDYSQGATQRYLQYMWDQLSRHYYARLNDWRVLLNTNYGFVLRDIRNLGI